MSDSSDVNNVLIAFYEGRVPDTCGRRLVEIQSWDLDDLEDVHDYVQWLFPLRTASLVNLDAPVLDDRVIAAFRARQDLRTALVRSLETMLRFYGFTLEGSMDQPRVTPSNEFSARARHWIKPYSHNYLRITRILACVRTLGLPQHAEAFFRALQDVYESEVEKGGCAISEETFSYWQAAATGTQKF